MQPIYFSWFTTTSNPHILLLYDTQVVLSPLTSLGFKFLTLHTHYTHVDARPTAGLRLSHVLGVIFIKTHLVCSHPGRGQVRYADSAHCPVPKQSKSGTVVNRDCPTMESLSSRKPRTSGICVYRECYVLFPVILLFLVIFPKLHEYIISKGFK